MRVISGSARGRSLKAVPGMSTRPTTDKVKEAIFSMIGPYFDGGAGLDLFAGTGGLGIEALSRGLDTCIFIDLEKKSLDTVRHNLEVTGLTDRAEIYRNDAGRALKALEKRGKQFGLVFLDPPYRFKITGELMQKMKGLGLLEQGATIVVEHDAADKLPEVFEGFVMQRRADYGDTAVTLYTFEDTGLN
ncbi:16S rRNA (guanine(966)-N(2))-methyltransferase RsmD [Paenibacillus chitinolyticus]|uniref:16S rRNA (guanine(966)-N(2))-methyltransferase RsmD n=1 Tax=Paenibacillus TaxID=44249 RepID=UPI002DBF74BD|nr:16S rRNA (guanine(966)-N(2))-methyltransferase RsmD [Paenibacillus chitinolyticus]MEC0247249.1 16S rRNA (guanine(966)-N(2))-methyltransferase RsmD [Paenibacillus chitinolyticus]